MIEIQRPNLNRVALPVAAWSAIAATLVVRHFWTAWFGFQFNVFVVDAVVTLVAIGLAIVGVRSQHWNKRVMLAFAPIVAFACLPTLATAAMLLFWTIGGSAP